MDIHKVLHWLGTEASVWASRAFPPNFQSTPKPQKSLKNYHYPPFSSQIIRRKNAIIIKIYGFLSTNICSCSRMYIHIEVIPRSTCIFTNEPFFVCFVYCSLQTVCLMPKFTTDINVCSSGSHSKTNDKGTFYEFMGVMTEDFTVFACTWFWFISINDQIGRSEEKIIYLNFDEFID